MEVQLSRRVSLRRRYEVTLPGDQVQWSGDTTRWLPDWPNRSRDFFPDSRCCFRQQYAAPMKIKWPARKDLSDDSQTPFFQIVFSLQHRTRTYTHDRTHERTHKPLARRKINKQKLKTTMYYSMHLELLLKSHTSVNYIHDHIHQGAVFTIKHIGEITFAVLHQLTAFEITYVSDLL